MTHSRYFNLLWEFKRQKCTSNTCPLRPWHDVRSWPSYFWTLISCLHHFLTEAASSSSTQVSGIDRFEFFPFGWFILAEDPESPQVEDLSVVLPPAMLVPLPKPFPWNGHLLVTLFPSPLSVPLRDFCVAHIHFHGGASSAFPKGIRANILLKNVKFSIMQLPQTPRLPLFPSLIF